MQGCDIHIMGAGQTDNSKAFSRCSKLREWLQSIPDALYLIGDNAYPLSNNLLIPHCQTALPMLGGEYRCSYY